MKTPHHLLSIATLLACLLVTATVGNAADRPNILFVMTDYTRGADMPVDDLPLASGSTFLEAPSDRKPKGVALAATRVRNAIAAKPVKLAEDDILMADFEGKTFGDWEATGDAFKSGPTSTKGRIAGFQGKRVLDTFIANETDGTTGTLTSPIFTVDRKRINFLIGGGKTTEKTCLNLLVDGKVVRTAVGNATKNSSNQKVLRWVSWDVSEFKDQKARLQVVDHHSGGWGHIVVDHIYRSNHPPRMQSN